MSRKSAMDAVFSAKPAPSLGAPNTAQPPAPPRLRSGAIAAMGASLQQLTESAKLAEQVEAGSAIVELETALIDGSFVSDRIADATDPTMEALIQSIRESGQQVPILVRPHPAATGRYQVAYGHRRLRAAAHLGIRVRSVIRTLSDQELVVAQGKENLDRRDLSFIEKAFFALRLEGLGFDRAVIVQALSTDKADLSRYLAVAKAIPEQIALAIGPAPKAGRARWLALAEVLDSATAKRAAERAIAEPDFPDLGTDARFSRILAAASTKPVEAAKPGAPTVVSASGRNVARVTQTGRDLKIAIDKGFDEAFAEFLVSRLPILADEFAKARGEGT